MSKKPPTEEERFLQETDNQLALFFGTEEKILQPQIADKNPPIAGVDCKTLQNKNPQDRRDKNLDDNAQSSGGANGCNLSKFFMVEGFRTILPKLFAVLGEVPTETWKYTLWEDIRINMQDLKDAQKLTVAAETLMDGTEQTLLHLVCMHNPPVDIVTTLVHASPDTARWKTKCGMLPLHVASRYKASEEAVRVLYDAYPEAISIPDKKSQIPLHHLFVPFSRDSLDKSDTTADIIPSIQSLSIVSMIISPNLITKRDKDLVTPLDLFANSSMNVDPAHSKKAQQILKIMLDTKPMGTLKLSTGFLKLPPSLLKYAISHPHIRRILNQKAAEPLYTFNLFTDYLIQILLIFAFINATQTRASYDLSYEELLASTNATQTRESYYLNKDVEINENDPWLQAIYFGVFYLSIREFIQIMSYVHVDLFSIWFYDPWNWFDILNIVLILSSSIMMKTKPLYLDEYNNLVMMAGGLQWFTLLYLSKTAYLSFSVFVRGVLRVTKELFPFFVSTVLFMGAFSFMYYVANFEQCGKVAPEISAEGSMEELSFCTMRKSFKNVLTMFLGNGMEQEDFSGSTFAMYNLFLSIAFSLFFVVLQMNVLIAVVNDSYEAVKIEGEAVFWEEKFEYLVGLDFMRSYTHNLSPFLYKSALIFYTRRATRWRENWDVYVRILLVGEKSSEKPMKKTLIQKLLWLLIRMNILILLFSWIIIGLISLGWLWPPQVREKLWCYEIIMHDEGETNVKDVEMRLEGKLTAFMLQMKSELSALEKKLDDNIFEVNQTVFAIMNDMNVKNDEKLKLLNDMMAIRKYTKHGRGQN